jgi:hypothetical protein
MKFYYNGKLIRTSKTHIYKYAVINIARDKCVACSATKEGAQATINSRLAEYERGIKNQTSIIKALEKGAKYCTYIDGKRTITLKLEARHTIEKAKEWLGYYTKDYEYVKENYKLVELEARA